MQGISKWLLVVAVVCIVGGTWLVVGLAPTSAAVEVTGDHWRNFDGHWSYWHDGDKRWYYTDGVHWYYHNGVGWALYQFDKLFGRTGFHPGDYHVPVEREKIVVPKHDIYHHR